jgi:hypothetical protein
LLIKTNLALHLSSAVTAKFQRFVPVGFFKPSKIARNAATNV